MGATQANDLPRQRTNADMRPRTLPARGPIRTTLNASRPGAGSPASSSRTLPGRSGTRLNSRKPPPIQAPATVVTTTQQGGHGPRDGSGEEDGEAQEAAGQQPHL